MTEPSGLGHTEVSVLIAAPRLTVYQACLDPEALVRWRVPDAMTGEMHAFDPRPGGGFRMSLTYQDPQQAGKTAGATDTFEGRFAEVVPGEKIVEVIEFESDDPRFAGQLRMTTSFADAAGGTQITVRCDGIPAGVRPEDNETGTRQSLRKLARLLTS